MRSRSRDNDILKDDLFQSDAKQISDVRHAWNRCVIHVFLKPVVYTFHKSKLMIVKLV